MKKMITYKKTVEFFKKVCYHTIALIKLKFLDGVSPSGKATDSDSVIRRFESYYPSQKNRQVSTCRFFYPIRRLGMESRVSVYVIAIGVWHHRRCISCGLIPYDCYAINSIPQQVEDTIHAFCVIWYVSSSPYENSQKYLFCPPYTEKERFLPFFFYPLQKQWHIITL